MCLSVYINIITFFYLNKSSNQLTFLTIVISPCKQQHPLVHLLLRHKILTKKEQNQSKNEFSKSTS